MADSKLLKEFWDFLWLIQDEKFQLMSSHIKDALARGIHVEINVDTEPGVIMAWELWEQLGFPKGSNEFTHVAIDTFPTNTMWSRGEGLSISYTSITAPRRM